MSIDGFHLLRPELAWLAMPLLLSLWLYLRGNRQQSQWRRHIDPELLPYLLQQGGHKSRALWPALLIASVTYIALLGPSWEKIPSPVQRNTAGLVIVLDLSPSMLAEDVQPSRLQRAKFAIRDILRLRGDGQTGLVAFAGDAFVVAPLTDDTNTLNTLLPSLHPEMMPLAGSNPRAGLEAATALLTRAEVSKGKILLISDGLESWQMPALLEFAQDSAHPLSILGVGTEDGAPIPLSEGGFARSEAGDIIVASLSSDYFSELAHQASGQYIAHRDLSEAALNRLVNGALELSETDDSRRFEQWQDGGVWLSLILLPLALLAYRRGVLAVLLIPLLWQPEASLASPWQTDDQRAAELFADQPGEAAKLFEDPMWRGAAHYRAGEFDAAAKAFAEADSSDAHYNRGNALAKAGQLEQALNAYQQALELNPEHRDASGNKSLIEQLLQEQEQQPQQQQGDDSQNSDKGKQDSEGGQGDDSSSQQNTGDNKPQGDQQQNSQSAPSDTDSDNSAEQQRDSGGDDSDSPADDQQQAASRAAQEQLAEQHAQQQDYAADDDNGPAGQQQTQATRPDKTEGEESAEAASTAGVEQPLSEEEQAQEQWLRNIPDSSDQLLRNKFKYQYLQRRRRGEVPERENYAPY